MPMKLLKEKLEFEDYAHLTDAFYIKRLASAASENISDELAEKIKIVNKDIRDAYNLYLKETGRKF